MIYQFCHRENYKPLPQKATFITKPRNSLFLLICLTEIQHSQNKPPQSLKNKKLIAKNRK